MDYGNEIKSQIKSKYKEQEDNQSQEKVGNKKIENTTSFLTQRRTIGCSDTKETESLNEYIFVMQEMCMLSYIVQLRKAPYGLDNSLHL